MKNCGKVHPENQNLTTDYTDYTDDEEVVKMIQKPVCCILKSVKSV